MTENQTTQTPYERGAAAYEYMTVRVDRDRESLYRDAYRNFGWAEDGYGSTTSGSTKVSLKFKRDRRLKNRPMVLELQRKCDGALASIDRLEQSKTAMPLASALLVGLVGTAFLAGAVFSMEAGMLLLSIVFGLIGFAGWLGGYLVHGRAKAWKAAQVEPQIDRQYDTVFETGEQVRRLLD